MASLMRKLETLFDSEKAASMVRMPNILTVIYTPSLLIPVSCFREGGVCCQASYSRLVERERAMLRTAIIALFQTDNSRKFRLISF